MFCKNCGTEVTGAQFCPKCGTKTGGQSTSGTNTGYQAYNGQAKQQTSQAASTGSGTTPLVLGILGIIFIFVFSLVGIILCIIAAATGNNARKILPEGDRGAATTGYILGMIGIVIFIIKIIVAAAIGAAFLGMVF